jgi:dolichol-phosphate mannosyltransferase
MQGNAVQIIISAVGLFFGIIFILMGILGEYIGRVLAETRSRPRFINSEETA